MRRLGAGLVTVLAVVLAVRREFLDMPDYLFDDWAPAIGIYATGLGVIVAILAGKATRMGGPGFLRRALVSVAGGGVVVPLCFLLVVSLVYTLLGGAWGLLGILRVWSHWLHAWVVGGVFGVAAAVFWPAKKHEAPGTAQ